MINFEKLYDLSAEKGVSLSDICLRLCVNQNYFKEIENDNHEIPGERMAIIAEMLGTTVEYLQDNEPAFVRSHIKSYAISHNDSWVSISNVTGVEITQVANWHKGISSGYMKYLPELSSLFEITEEELIGKTNPRPKRVIPTISDELFIRLQEDPFGIEFLEGYYQLSEEKRDKLKAFYHDLLIEMKSKNDRSNV